MQLIDTHCHLDFPIFELSRTEVLASAFRVGVSDIVIPGVSAEGWPNIKALASVNNESLPTLHMAFGMHPCFLDEHKIQYLEQLEILLSSENACAVGEIGLDLFIPNACLEQQLLFLIPQLELARKFKLPVLLHVRKAHDQMLKQLRHLKLVKAGVVHAFSGSEQQAYQYIELGFKLGLGGTVTYDRALKLRRIVQSMPLDSFVLETDAPDMPLSGFKGEPNQPARVFDVAKMVAELKGCSIEEVAAITTFQASQLLGIDL